MSWTRNVKGKGWRAEARGPADATGHRKVVPVGPYRANKALAKADQEAHDAKAERLGAARKPANAATSIADLLDRWEDSGKSKDRGSIASRADTRRSVETIRDGLKATYIRDLDADALDRWVTANPVGAERKVQRLLRFLRWAAGAPGVPFDTAITSVELPKRKRRAVGDLLTDKQVAKILLIAYEEGGSSAGVAVEHLALYACRPIDVCRVRCVGFDPAGPRITYKVTKNGRAQRHLLHLNHAKKLARLCAGRASDAHLFLDPYGRPWKLGPNGKSAQGLTDWYDRHVGEKLVAEGVLKPEQAGIYNLKSWAMTRLGRAAKGDRAATISMSGHLTQAMVDTYTRTNEIAQRALIAATPMGPTGDVMDPEAIHVELAAVEPLADVVPAHALKPYPQTPRPVRRGFSAMTPEKHSALARAGAAALAKSGKRHRLSPEAAREAQRKSAEARRRNAAARRTGDAA